MSDNCVKCTKPADMECYRCGDPYCSEMCQVSDWNAHRYICAKIPNLKLRDGKIVSSSSSEKPMNNSSETPKQATSKVVESHVEKVPAKIETIKKPEVSFKEAPQRDAPKQKIEIHSTNVQSVEPPVAKAPINIRTFGMRPSSVKAVPEAPKRFKFQDLGKREWSVTGKIRVALAGLVDPDNITNMVLCDEKYQDEFYSISEKVQNFCKDKKSEGYTPELDEVVLCLFKDDSLWYRAHVISKDGDSFTVQYVDYGNFDKVNKNEIMQLPDELKFDCVTKVFKIFNCPASSDDLSEEQSVILGSNVFMIHNIKQKDGRFGCEIFGF